MLGTALLAWTGGNWIVLALYMSVLAAITTASTFLVPETRGRDLLRTEDAIGLSQTEQDTATDILAPSGVVLEDDNQIVRWHQPCKLWGEHAGAWITFRELAP